GNIVSVDSSHRHKALSRCHITGFYDVSVPFYGTGGATRMFAPQKGAGPEMVEALDNWMAQLCLLYSRYSGREIRHIPGSGAAGGIGGALRAFLGASMTPGIWHVLNLSGMGRALDTCTLVITGEGRSDIQTLRGKVPRGVLDYVREYDSECGGGRRTKVVLLAGQVSDRQELLEAGFDDVIQATPPGTSLEDAIQPCNAMANITRALRVSLG
ncbi:MAG: glycerate kinase, partial [Bacteroidales bacterium]|nr:glycerate kinase [Bacteroidales bacterium]